MQSWRDTTNHLAIHPAVPPRTKEGVVCSKRQHLDVTLSNYGLGKGINLAHVRIGWNNTLTGFARYHLYTSVCLAYVPIACLMNEGIKMRKTFPSSQPNFTDIEWLPPIQSASKW